MGRKGDQDEVLLKKRKRSNSGVGRRNQEEEKKKLKKGGKEVDRDDGFVSLLEDDGNDQGARGDREIVVVEDVKEDGKAQGEGEVGVPAGKRKKRLSKKGKKAWRKNIDESKALDAITTDKWKREAETGSSDGFFVDKKKTMKQKRLQDMTPEERRNYHREKVLASEGGLIPANKVPTAPMVKKRKLSEDNLTPMARTRLHKLSEKLKKHPSSTIPEPKSVIPHLRERTSYDLWNEETPEEAEENKKAPPEGALLPKSKLGKNKTPLKPEVSSIPAVEVPLPGISINPSYDDHQDALGVAVAMVMKIDAEEEELAKRLEKPLSRKEQRRRRREGTLKDEEEDKAIVKEAEEEEEEEEEEGGSGTKKRPTFDPQFSLKKSEKERRKEKEKKKRRREEHRKQSEKRRMSKVESIDKLLSTLERKELKTIQRKERKEERKKEQLSKPRRLGKLKLELDEMLPEVLPTDELPENGRLLRVEPSKVNLIRDRFRNMMKRNLVEPRIRQVKARKYKLKWNTKPSKRD